MKIEGKTKETLISIIAASPQVKQIIDIYLDAKEINPTDYLLDISFELQPIDKKEVIG
jgi:hypothetical protein